jgi:hypothetical protein
MQRHDCSCIDACQYASRVQGGGKAAQRLDAGSRAVVE